MWTPLQKQRTVRTHLIVQSRPQQWTHNLTHPSEVAKAILQAVSAISSTEPEIIDTMISIAYNFSFTCYNFMSL
jgi:hypothetical protein